MKIILKVIPIIYALCVTYISYQSSTWVGGLIEEPAVSDTIFDVIRFVCFISSYVLYVLALKGKLNIKYCYYVLLLHLGLFVSI